MSMNHHTQYAPTPAISRLQPSRRRHGGAWTAILAAVLMSFSMSGIAASQSTGEGHEGNGYPGPQAALDDAQLRQIVHHLAEIGSVEQRAQFMGIAKVAAVDFNAFEQQARQARGRRMQLVLRDAIDRGALGRTRLEEMQVIDQRSHRVDRLLIELAGVLTPQQRAQMSAHVQASTD